ncbi:MAG: UDP-N-acetylglucosamine 2-epimerase (non-hydrolyzing) [Turicibacter sp.]|nr:UDP-N-acetylglucosamine 2-epimerase (non-hydrolyzing) [Turicibacter sp.]
MMKIRVMTVVGTRPEIIRLSECIKACDRHFQHTLVHTGQNYDYELNEIFFEEMNIRRPDVFLAVAGADLGETMGNILAKSYRLFAEKKPNALLILGDTNSALCAISAKRLKIPIFHMEAGNRCFDENVPEEINRRIIDHISDVNLPYTEHSRRYLLAEGVRRDFIFVTGSPMTEVLNVHKNAIEGSGVLAKLGLERGRYFVVSAHREENIDNERTFVGLMTALNRIAEEYALPIIYSTHPRSRKRIEERGFKFNPLIKSLPPLGFFDYNHLQKNSFCVLSDSGTLSEEAAILGFPAVIIRTATERPEVLDKGAIVMGGVEENGIVQAVRLVRELWENGNKPSAVLDYQDLNVAGKVVRLVQSYVGVVDRVVWRK